MIEACAVCGGNEFTSVTVFDDGMGNSYPSTMKLMTPIYSLAGYNLKEIHCDECGFAPSVYWLKEKNVV